MVVNVKPHTVLYDTLQPSSKLAPVQNQPINYIPGNTTGTYFKIQYVFSGETTQLLFAEKPSTHQQFVIKILKKYEDLRYHMGTVNERQQCQLEALKRNRQFTSDVYIGLARLNSLDLATKEVYLDEIIKEPEDVRFHEEAEYVLVMCWLPECRQLDNLLATKQTPILMHYMELLSEVIGEMHKQCTKSEVSIPGEPVWGSCKQLEQKLEHNLPYLTLVLNVAKNELRDSYPSMKRTFSKLKKLMLRAMKQPEFLSYFEERLHQHYILRCHGDLKATNIWILLPDYPAIQANREHVKILDAIDFNPSYCNIDVLADMAMLAVDIEVRASHQAAQHFIRHYLEITGQDNKIAKAVLAYYLVEKAMVGVIVNFVYDKLPDTGTRYLCVAQRYMAELQRCEREMRFKSFVKTILANTSCNQLLRGPEYLLGVSQPGLSLIGPVQTFQGD